MNPMAAATEPSRPHPGTILHVDMDAFFAAIEQREQPELRGKPVVVGSPRDQRGVVATASYEARQFGIHSAMPSRTAYQRCPHAIFVPVRHELYAAVSRRVMALFRGITPIVEPLSIDEAFLDVSGVVRPDRDPVDLAREIKAKLRRQLGLTGSVGVAPNKFLAKLASDMEKPDGLTVTPSTPTAIRAFLAPLPIRKIWGVGPHTAEKLLKRGIRTIGDIQKRSEHDMIRLLGTGFGRQVYRLAFGIDERRVSPEPHEEKSISNEETFEKDVSDPTVIRHTLLRLTEKVGRRLRAAGKLASTGQIKFRYADFQTFTRQQTLPHATHTDHDLLHCAKSLFERVSLQQPIRLIGFGASGLLDVDAPRPPRQLELFDNPEDDDIERYQALDRAVDELRQRFGPQILMRGLPATKPGAEKKTAGYSTLRAGGQVE